MIPVHLTSISASTKPFSCCILSLGVQVCRLKIARMITLSKKEVVLHKQPKMQPAVHTMVFHYEHGKEIICSSSLQTRKKWLAPPEKASINIRCR